MYRDAIMLEMHTHTQHAYTQMHLHRPHMRLLLVTAPALVLHTDAAAVATSQSLWNVVVACCGARVFGASAKRCESRARARVETVY